MILAAIAGIVLGFSLSIPPGPISVAIIRKGMEGDGESGRLIGIGAAAIDVVYAVIAALASSAILRGVGDFLDGSAWFELIFQIVCIGILLFLGYRYFHVTARDLAETAEEEEQQESTARRFGASSGLMLGVFMAVMNLANPSFLPTMIAVAGALHAEEILTTEPLSIAGYAVGFGIGVFLWFLLLLRIVVYMRKRLPVAYFRYIFRFSGGAFYVFALIIGIRVVIATDWSAL